MSNSGVVTVVRGAAEPSAAFTTSGLGGLVPTDVYSVGTWDGAGGAAPDAPSFTGAALTTTGLPVHLYAQPCVAIFPYHAA